MCLWICENIFSINYKTNLKCLLKKNLPGTVLEMIKPFMKKGFIPCFPIILTSLTNALQFSITSSIFHLCLFPSLISEPAVLVAGLAPIKPPLREPL